MLNHTQSFVIAMVAFGLFSLIPLHFTGVIGRTPKVGEMYVANHGGSPFIEPVTNRVDGVKDGWVRLQEVNGPYHKDLTFQTFRCVYKKCE